MAVVGFDVGSYKSVVAAARNRGIDILVNEVSNRFTPSLVGFLGDRRLLGEVARTQEVMNSRNTVANITRLLGRDLEESEVQAVEKSFVSCELVADADGAAAAAVEYCGEPRTFSMVQLQAMFLTNLKHTAENELKTAVTDVVISVPAYYTDRQRHALQSAASIAGLNVLRVANDSAAAALQYGITRAPELPEKESRHVVIVDVGHSAMTVSVTAFTKEGAVVKATTWDRAFGGRVLDQVLVRHFAAEILAKHKVDVMTKPKALLRLQLACERAKKLLSANIKAPLNVECLTDTVDVNSSITRDQLEEMIKEPLQRIAPTILRALEMAGLTKEQVDFVELIGGSVRVPAIKAGIHAVFDNRENVISTTLNFDEAVSRGCALQCAMISPLFKVREYAIKDTVSYDIDLSWRTGGEAKRERLFKAGDPMPSTKQLSVSASEPFEIEATYAEASQLPAGTRPTIARFVVQAKPAKDGSNSDVKVRLRVNPSGVFTLESAQAVEEIEDAAGAAAAAAAPAPAAAAAPAASMEEDGEEVTPAASTDALPAKKRKVRKTDLVVAPRTSALSEAALNDLRDREVQMAASDKLIIDTLEAKNRLEEFVYDARSKLESSHVEFMAEADREALLKELQANEDWLYAEGDTATKGVFAERLKALNAKFAPVQERFVEADNRPAAEAALRATAAEWIANAEKAEEHIDANARKLVTDEAAKKLKWLEEALAKQAATPKTAPVAVTVSQINGEREGLMYFARPILNKPKPKVEVPKTETPKPESPKPEDNKMDVEEPAAQAKAEDAMDVD